MLSQTVALVLADQTIRVGQYEEDWPDQKAVHCKPIGLRRRSGMVCPIVRERKGYALVCLVSSFDHLDRTAA